MTLIAIIKSQGSFWIGPETREAHEARAIKFVLLVSFLIGTWNLELGTWFAKHVLGP